MPTTADEFESERSRAAVTVACLQWLRCTGPEIPPTSNPARVTSPDAAEPLRDVLENPSPIHHHHEPAHPLWDRWIDG